MVHRNELHQAHAALTMAASCLNKPIACRPAEGMPAASRSQSEGKPPEAHLAAGRTHEAAQHHASSKGGTTPTEKRRKCRRLLHGYPDMAKNGNLHDQEHVGTHGLSCQFVALPFTNARACEHQPLSCHALSRQHPASSPAKPVPATWCDGVQSRKGFPGAQGLGPEHITEMTTHIHILTFALLP